MLQRSKNGCAVLVFNELGLKSDGMLIAASAKMNKVN